jgi:hypothetical protein
VNIDVDGDCGNDGVLPVKRTFNSQIRVAGFGQKETFNHKQKRLPKELLMMTL